MQEDFGLAEIKRSELECCALCLLLSAQFEVFAPLQCQLHLVLANGAFESEHDLLRSLCLLVEDGLSLTTVAGLFTVITTLSLCEERCLAGLVLRHLVRGVLLASLALAECSAGLGNVDHFRELASVTLRMLRAGFVVR